MNALSDYFAMGGYAVFIWPSYGLALVLLIGMAIAAHRRMRAAERAVRQIDEVSTKTGRADRGA